MADAFEGTVVNGVRTYYDFQHFEAYLTAGRIPDYDSNLNGKIMLFEYFANRLNLSLGTIAFCLVMLILPSVIISKISPVKAIRFE